MLKLLKQGWKGEAPLSKVFWQLYVFYGLIVIFLADAFVDYFIAHEFTPLYIHNHNLDDVITISFPYFFFSSMCVFACSRGTKLLVRIFVRLIVILVLIAASFHLTRIG